MLCLIFKTDIFQNKKSLVRSVLQFVKMPNYHKTLKFIMLFLVELSSILNLYNIKYHTLHFPLKVILAKHIEFRRAV